VKELIRMCQNDEGCFCAGLKTLGDILMNFLEQKSNKIYSKSLLVSRMMFYDVSRSEKTLKKLGKNRSRFLSKFTTKNDPINFLGNFPPKKQK
jgi:hypothetical protein